MYNVTIKLAAYRKMHILYCYNHLDLIFFSRKCAGDLYIIALREERDTSLEDGGH